MSQMREITTINRNSNSDASDKLTNGISLLADTTSAEPNAQYSMTSTIAKNDRNNNNVMKKSMPPPVPPKKHQLRTSNSNNSITVKTNTDPVDDKRTQSNGSGTSKNDVINHNHGPNKTVADGNELHKLPNASLNVVDNGNGKGQPNHRRNLDSVTDCKSDPKTASGFVGIASSDNSKKLNNDDIVASTTASKSGTNSGTSHHCDNGMTITCFNSLLLLLF